MCIDFQRSLTCHVWGVCVCTTSLASHLSMDIRLLLCLGHCEYNAAVNTEVQIPLCCPVSIFFGWKPRSGTAESKPCVALKDEPGLNFTKVVNSQD